MIEYYCKVNESPNRLKLPTVSEVKDSLIQEFCEPTCPDAKDYHCPDHECPVWEALELLDHR